jgi:hypothetical protein
MRFKVVLIVVALGFNYTVHSRPRAAPTACRVQPVATLSLVIWVVVALSGIFYSFT